MREFLRIFGKNTLLLFIAAMIINSGLFLLSCQTERDITLTGDALSQYIEDYPAYLEKTKKESAALSSLPMYQSGFAADNVRKTADAYAALGRISPVYGDNRGTVLLIQYSISDMFLLAFLVMVTASLLQERKKGLVYMVRSTVKGRGALYLQRTAILAFASLFGAVMFSGGNVLAMLISFGSGGFSRPIQSLPEFMQCPYGITIGGYFLLSLMIRAAACFAAAMIFFLLISVLGTAAAYTSAALITAAELLMYLLVPPVSSLNALKYVNLFMLVRCDGYFSSCRFLNVFGNAVPALRCALIFLAFLIAALIIAGYFIHTKCYVSGKDILVKAAEKFGRLKEKLSLQHTLFGWESIKLLIRQGGLFFFAAAFLLALFTSLQYGYFYPTDFYESEYYDKYKGEITSERVSRAETDLEELEAEFDRIYARLEEMYSSGSYDEDLFADLDIRASRLKKRIEGLTSVLDDMRGGLSYTERTGHTVMLIRPYVYDLYFRRDKRTAARAAFFILIGIIGGVSGIFAFDRQNNMRPTILSAYRGRLPANISKLSAALIFCTLLCVSIHLIQLVHISRTFALNDISAPLQSLRFMRDFPIYMSIADFIILSFAVRASAACAIGLVCILISRLCPDTSSALGASVFALAVPSVFAEAVPAFSFFSAVYLLSGNFIVK